MKKFNGLNKDALNDANEAVFATIQTIKSMKRLFHENRTPSPEYTQFVSRFSQELFDRIVANKETWINPDFLNKVGEIHALIKKLHRLQQTEKSASVEDVIKDENLEHYRSMGHDHFQRQVKSVWDLGLSQMGSYTNYIENDVLKAKNLDRFSGMDFEVEDFVNDINRKAVARLDEIQSRLVEILLQTDTLTDEDIREAVDLEKEATNIVLGKKSF
jgi:hypothetical protein